MSLTRNVQKYENPSEKSVLTAWKHDFFEALKQPMASNTLFLRLETHYQNRKPVQHRLVPTLGWKHELPGFSSESVAQLSELRRELSATLRVNGIQVLHKKEEWMRHLKDKHEVGASYAKLCGAC